MQAVSSSQFGLELCAIQPPLPAAHNPAEHGVQVRSAILVAAFTSLRPEPSPTGPEQAVSATAAPAALIQKPSVGVQQTR